MEDKRKKNLPRRPRKEVDKKTGRRKMINVSKRADGSIRGGTVLKELGLSRPDRKPKPKAMTPLKRPGTLRPADKAAIKKNIWAPLYSNQPTSYLTKIFFYFYNHFLRRKYQS